MKPCGLRIRAAGRTSATLTPAGSPASCNGSIRTVPVKANLPGVAVAPDSGRSRQADGIYDSDSGWEFSAFLIVSLLVLAALGDGPFALKPDTLEGPSVVPAR